MFSALRFKVATLFEKVAFFLESVLTEFKQEYLAPR